eukprot:jgi/Mesvir1/24393/Mv11061-RA.1
MAALCAQHSMAHFGGSAALKRWSAAGCGRSALKNAGRKAEPLLTSPPKQDGWSSPRSLVPPCRNSLPHTRHSTGNHLHAPIVAIPTPFESSNNAVNLRGFDYILHFLEERGVQCVLVNGTSGEFPSLTLEERIQILEHCRKVSKLQIVVNISSCCMGDCVALYRHAASRHLADAALLLPPYYFANPREDGTLSFIRQVIHHCGWNAKSPGEPGKYPIPIYLYNFPYHTQATLTPAMFGALAAEFPSDILPGLKDSSGDMAACDGFKAVAKDRLIYVGNDRGASSVLERGLDGSVTGASVATIQYMVDLDRCFRAGDREGMAKCQASVDQWIGFSATLPHLSEIAVTKAALNVISKGIVSRQVRPPLVTATPDESKAIAREIEAIASRSMAKA